MQYTLMNGSTLTMLSSISLHDISLSAVIDWQAHTENVSPVEHRLQLNEYKTEEDVSELPTNSGLHTITHQITSSYL